MTDNHPSVWDPASNEAIVATIAHALRYQSKRPVHDGDRLIAFVAAERIVKALQRAYTITPAKLRGRSLASRSGCEGG